MEGVATVTAEVAGNQSPGMIKINTHDYSGTNTGGKNYCLNGCGCWTSSSNSGGPEGMDPQGICPLPPTPGKRRVLN